MSRLQKLAAVAWFAFTAGAARPATITETTAFTIQSPAASNLAPQTVNVSTPQFNPALGTFESGATTITGTTGIGLEFFNTGAGGPYDILLSDTLTVGGVPGLFIEELTGTIPADQPAFITAHRNVSLWSGGPVRPRGSGRRYGNVEPALQPALPFTHH